jgi:hypothetical protein
MAGILCRSYFLYLRLNAANYVTKDRNVGVSLELFKVCILLHISLNLPCAVYSF